MAHVGEMVYAFGGHPTCTTENSCHQEGLDNVSAFHDIKYPNVFVMVKN